MSTYGDDAARSDLTNSLTGIRCPYPEVPPSHLDHEPVRGSPQANSGSLAKSQALPETTCAVCPSLRRRGVFVGPELPRPWIIDSHALHPATRNLRVPLDQCMLTSFNAVIQCLLVYFSSFIIEKPQPAFVKRSALACQFELHAKKVNFASHLALARLGFCLSYGS